MITGNWYSFDTILFISFLFFVHAILETFPQIKYNLILSQGSEIQLQGRNTP